MTFMTLMTAMTLTTIYSLGFYDLMPMPKTSITLSTIPDSTPPLPCVFDLEDGRASSIQSGLPPLVIIYDLGPFPGEQDSSLKIAGILLVCQTRRHWNRRPSSLADNPNFGLFGPL